jgi:heme/copper-type cytochrome/quinol oxidase subunit 3
VRQSGDREPDDVPVVGSVVMLFLTVYFLLFESRDVRERGWARYFSDIWNLIVILSIALVVSTTCLFLAGRSIQDDNRHVRGTVIAAGACICLSFVSYLKTTFLKFSIFVGGISRVRYDVLHYLLHVFRMIHMRSPTVFGR